MWDVGSALCFDVADNDLECEDHARRRKKRIIANLGGSARI